MQIFKEGEYCKVWYQGVWKDALYYRKGVRYGEHLVWILEDGEATLYRVNTHEEIKAGEQEATK